VTAVADPQAGAPLSAAPPPMRREAERERELRVMKWRATGLLVVVTIAWVCVAALGTKDGWMGYLRAGLEASMVGGLADWFAVTALFRHPLGLPIPHTAIIKARKDQFARTLGEFVQEHFLSADAITSRIRASQGVARSAAWLANPANANAVAGHVAEIAVRIADVARDEDVQRMIDNEIRNAVERVPLAPLAGRALRFMTVQQRHQELLDALLKGGQRVLVEHRAELHARFAEQSPWWLPGAVEDQIFDRLLNGVISLLDAVNRDPEHELRREFDRRVAEFADRLEHAPELRERGERLKHELLSQPQLRAWTASLWCDIKANLRAQAADPDSELRRRLADAIAAAAMRLRDDPDLQRSADELLDTGVRYVVSHFHDELVSLVSGTIARWDADETSRRLELLLGPDLQFIRINGTVVGGLAGVAIHSVGTLL
jgi:uncharacterized membrane-anchored protein YjiN (DUF445 family)